MRTYLLIGLGISIVGLFILSMAHAYRAGRQVERLTQLEANVEAFVKSKGIQNEVSAMDRYSICIDLGGLSDDCEQLRRVEQTSPSQ